MKLIAFMHVLFRIKLLSPRGLYYLFAAIRRYGINLMALLSVSERVHGGQTALIDGRETLTYAELFSQSEQLAYALRHHYRLDGSRKAALLCRNHASLVKGVFAVSLTGADMVLLNADMSPRQFNELLEGTSIDLLIYDEELASIVDPSSYKGDKLLTYHDRLPSIHALLRASGKSGIASTRTGRSMRSSSGKLLLLTGGTTGKAKEAAHKPSLFRYLPPLSALLTRMNLTTYRTVYIATPVYHGYGVAFLLLSIALGKKIVLSAGFDAAEACGLIREHRVEAVTVVPLMLHKMLQHNRDDLKTLACIASGGAELNPKLAAEATSKLGHVLYNLYGTSEAGLNLIATPQDLNYSASTVGRPVPGTGLRLLDSGMKPAKPGSIGRLCVHNGWSMLGRRGRWIETGDLAYRDERGYYFLMGRVDDMIVSGGENVYPVEVERILLQHPLIEDVSVTGIPDELFGQRLKAAVQLVPDSELTSEDLTEWLRPRAARYQMPKEIVFVSRLPYTHLGKRDKKRRPEDGI